MIFWADGFTVEDVSAEEEEAKAKAERKDESESIILDERVSKERTKGNAEAEYGEDKGKDQEKK